jgi:hypothetical protein
MATAVQFELPTDACAAKRSIQYLMREICGLGCLLAQQVSLREVVNAFDGIDVSAVSVQPITLEHAYLEVLHGAPRIEAAIGQATEL